MSDTKVNCIVQCDSLAYLRTIQDESVQMIYVDPPFNTGHTQSNISAVVHKNTEKMSYSDRFDDYVEFLRPFMLEAKRVLSIDGTLCVHLDWHEVHYVKVMLDGIFGRDNFLNEVIWHYDFGGRGKDRWPRKHDNILVYAKREGEHIFNYDQIDRVPYMSAVTKTNSRFVTPEKAARGKTLTDVWWRSVIGTSSKERTGYPTQKPLEIVERLVRMHSSSGKTVLDFFAGSGTTGVAASRQGRKFILIDQNPIAVRTICRRFESLGIDATLQIPSIVKDHGQVEIDRVETAHQSCDQ